MERRNFLGYTAAVGASLMLEPLKAFAIPAGGKTKLALVGTGIRGTSFWGINLLKNFGDAVEYVGLCDINSGRLAYAKQAMRVGCPVFTDFKAMLRQTKPDYVIVATVDASHDEQIVTALQMGFNVITEKPMTTDEVKCKRILQAEKESGKKVLVAFNYRHSMHAMQLKELLAAQRIGKITSVDFNWYLNVYHGADYFRRWHGLLSKSGSLWVHKATHHFDLLNWWLNSEPVEVMAYGSLDHYGKNNSFRGKSCRDCSHKAQCKYHWDITKDDALVNLYVKNEHLDGYIRDGCVWRTEIDIWDKMSAQIKYANSVIVNYSLTTYSPYEGWQIAFNGIDGRIETWEDIPYLQKVTENQASRHAVEMSNSDDAVEGEVREIVVMDNFKEGYEIFTTPKIKGGHGGGDIRMHRRMFVDPADNPHQVLAGTRDGAMSILIGIAARKSIAENRPVRIEELTDLKPMSVRHA
jgi:predicted dehydrogenase